MYGIEPLSGKKYRASLLKGDLGLPASDRISKIIGYSHLAFGDGGGAPGSESSTATSLGNELCRKLCSSRYYVEAVSSGGNFTVDGQEYSISTYQTGTLALFFIFEGAEGSFSGIDEIAIFAGVDYATGFTHTAVPSVSNDIGLNFNRSFYGPENEIYEIIVATGGEPGIDSGSAYFSVSASGTDSGQVTQITSFGQEYGIGSFGLLVSFSAPTAMSNPAFVLGDKWTIYCTANHAAYDYAEHGVWSTANPSGEVLNPGSMCKLTNVSSFSKSQYVDWRHIEIIEIT